MTKKMLINATHPEENRVAIVEDGILTELDIEIAGKEQTRGNIYKAVVVRVEPGLQAAFIDYGGERFGFLQMGEIHPSLVRSAEANGEKSRPRINDVLRRGQELLVQIVKEERGTKGAALTTFLSLPGRYMVLLPQTDTKGVSRKIEEESQRKKLKEAMASLDLPANTGYIVRTAGIGQKKEELKRDFDYLVRVHDKIQLLGKTAKAPSLIYKESNLVIRSIRDYFSADMDEVLVDDPRVFQEAREFFQEVMPDFARLVKLHQEKRPIFSRYQIEDQIETITRSKVALPSGGSIVIDTTEALVAIDVNSGKMAGESGVEATAFKTNVEAAAEIGRQLRLRDLGGLVVIDFIDMRDRKHIRDVEKALKDALKNDKARVTVGRISQFGLLEMSRQRIKAALAEGSFLPCQHCHGTGRVKSAEAQGIAFLRKIHGGLAKGQVSRIDGDVPLEVATYLLNNKREELLELERKHQVFISIKGHPDFIAGQMELTFQKRDKEEKPRLEAGDGGIAESIETPAAVDEPPLPVAAEETEEAAAAETAVETAARKKRKRSRRRKKEETGEVLPADAPSAEVLAESGQPPATDQMVPPEQEEKLEETGIDKPESKPKRSRRRKQTPGVESQFDEPIMLPSSGEDSTSIEEKGRSQEEERKEEKDAIGGMAAAEPLPGEPGTETEPAAGDVRKRRRRRRRKKHPPAAGAVEGAAMAPEHGTGPAEPPASSAAALDASAGMASEETPAAAEKNEPSAPSRKRRSSPRKKPADTAPEKIPPALDAASVTLESTPKNEEQPAPSKTPRKRRSARSKTVAEPKTHAAEEKLANKSEKAAEKIPELEGAGTSDQKN